jgi:ribonuclease P protein component
VGASLELPPGERFPKALRLLRRRDFVGVQQRGVKVSVDLLIALALRSAREETRLGITVSSKVGNAVVRGRIRRVLRELFRKRRHQLPKGLDVVLIAKASAKDAGFHRFAKAFDDACAKLRKAFP